MMQKGIFITGTDTDVGKTIVTAGLLNLLRSKGINAVPMKPVQTGCVLQNGEYSVPDLDFSISCSGLTYTAEEYNLMSPYRYGPACSPHLAGRLTDDFPRIENIIDNLKKLEMRNDFIIIEGAGGIMVPLNDNDMMIDLMKATGYPVILAAHTGLGTINHTLLSIQVLRSAGIDIIGVIFNNTKPPSETSAFIREDNVKAIAEFGSVNVLGVIDYLGDVHNNFDILKECFKRAVDYKTIDRLVFD